MDDLFCVSKSYILFTKIAHITFYSCHDFNSKTFKKPNLQNIETLRQTKKYT